MLTYPKSTMRVRRMPMHLSSGHVTLVPTLVHNFTLPPNFPQSDLERQVDSRWALPKFLVLFAPCVNKPKFFLLSILWPVIMIEEYKSMRKRPYLQQHLTRYNCSGSLVVTKITTWESTKFNIYSSSTKTQKMHLQIRNISNMEKIWRNLLALAYYYFTQSNQQKWKQRIYYGTTHFQ